MDYIELINKAITKGEVVQLLRGEKEYEVVVSEFVPDIFPTEINSVLVNCFYKQFGVIEKIDKIFINTIQKLLNGNACDVYIAVLYFDACLFQEERRKATFEIEKEVLIEKIKIGINKYKQNLQHEVTFSNGMKKQNPWRNIENFNRSYMIKYGFHIIE